MKQALAIVRRKQREVMLSPPSKWREACITILKELEDEYLDILWESGEEA